MSGGASQRWKVAILLVLNSALIVAIAHRARDLRDAWRVHNMVVESRAELVGTSRKR